MSKSILQSKTFWANLITLGATAAGYLPPKYAAMVLPVLNIGLRLVTTDPVHLFPPSGGAVAGVIVLLLLIPSSARAQGPIYTSAQKFAQLASDSTVGAAVALDTWSSWKAQNRARAFECQALRDGIVEGVGLLGQHFIKSPRPDGSGNGMPSIHSMYAGSGFRASNPWVTAALALATAYLRTAGDRHTDPQALIGLAAGVGVSFIRCGS